ncbi:MAG: hypothetical protein GEU95_10510 [Rhizobiales bacterium]|nr:hypothetical protein [Hyphomicrobiales bacterium]
MAPAATCVYELTIDALRNNSRLRKALHIIGPIAGTATAGLLQLASKFTVDWWNVGLNVASACTAIFVVIVAVLLAVTDKGGPEALREAHLSDERARRLEKEKEDIFVEIDKAAAKFGSLTTLYATSIALRELIEPVLSVGPGDKLAQSARLAAMLDILLTNKKELFGIIDERWNFSVYTYDAERDELICSACRRRDRADEEAEHRAWPSGIGQIGLAYRDGQEVVVGDVQNPDFEAYFRAPPGLHRPDDGERYRSIAAIPISTDGGPPRGVVIGTSDVQGRFVPSSARPPQDWDTVEPLRVLAGMLVILLSATELHDRLGGQNGDR